jgi:enolase
MANIIRSITAREILDSRGNPTVEAKVVLENGIIGVAAVPSGASTGSHEAIELRDGARKRYGGKGVLKAVKHVNTIIASGLLGKDAREQKSIDAWMIAADGTNNKKKLGANAILSVSLAVCRAAAASSGKPLYEYIRECYGLKEKGYRLPVPMMNVVNGGRHADNGLTVQEFMLLPVHKEFSERVRMGSQIFHSLGAILREKGYTTGVGDEGGFAPQLTNNEQALQLLVAAIKASDLVPGKNVYLGMDMAASEFYHAGKYYFLSQKQASTPDKIMSVLERWIKKYPLISIEDPLAEDDWEAWTKFTKKFGKHIRVVGDDVFVTNVERIGQGIAQGVGNTVLIKLNQIGTLTETIAAIELARKHNYAVVISHRSGETADTFISDLSVAVNAEFIKAGSLSRSERVEKYNRLMEIELETRS